IRCDETRRMPQLPPRWPGPASAQSVADEQTDEGKGPEEHDRAQDPMDKGGTVPHPGTGVDSDRSGEVSDKEQGDDRKDAYPQMSSKTPGVEEGHQRNA